MQHNKLYIYSHFVVSGSVYEKIDSCLQEFSEMNLKGGDINASTFQGAVYFIHWSNAILFSSCMCMSIG